MNLTEAVQSAGVVGAGGAGFPTHIKLNTEAECFIVNAAECEPLIETDKYLCRTNADQIVEGIMIISKHLNAKRSVIALKKKYREEIDCLEKAIVRAAATIEIFEMSTFYPAGDEQVIVQQVCNKSVPERGIPLDVGVVVDNVGTVLNVVDALKGIPVTEKYLSVVGEVEKPIMLKVPLGTSIRECITKAKPKIVNYAVVMGGPMMGRVVEHKEQIDRLVVTKTTGNIIVLPPDHFLIKWTKVSMERIIMQARSACIQCRMCTDLCPRYLIGHKIRPHVVMRNIWREPFITDQKEYIESFGDALNCCDCGICELFACPMGLSPRRVNDLMKKQLKTKGIQVERNKMPVAREDVDIHKVPTGRLISRLGLSDYDGLHAHECYDFIPEEVQIPFSQHIGMPALPVIKVGDQVKKGDLIAKANEQGLSAQIHASIDGVVTEVTDTGAKIRQKEVSST